MTRPLSQTAKTSPSHGEDMGSIPVGVTSGKVPPPIITHESQSRFLAVHWCWRHLLFFCPKGHALQVAIYAEDMQFLQIDHIPAPFFRKTVVACFFY